MLIMHGRPFSMSLLGEADMGVKLYAREGFEAHHGVSRRGVRSGPEGWGSGANSSYQGFNFVGHEPGTSKWIAIGFKSASSAEDTPVHRSLDNGQTWSDPNSSPPRALLGNTGGISLAVGNRVAFNSTNGIWFALTTRYLSLQDHVYANRSSDTGATWVQTSLSSTLSSFPYDVAASVAIWDSSLNNFLVFSKEQGHIARASATSTSSSWSYLGNIASKLGVPTVEVNAGCYHEGVMILGVAITGGTPSYRHGAIITSSDGGGSWTIRQVFDPGLSEATPYIPVQLATNAIQAQANPRVVVSLEAEEPWSSIDGITWEAATSNVQLANGQGVNYFGPSVGFLHSAEGTGFALRQSFDGLSWRVLGMSWPNTWMGLGSWEPFEEVAPYRAGSEASIHTSPINSADGNFYYFTRKATEESQFSHGVDVPLTDPLVDGVATMYFKVIAQTEDRVDDTVHLGIGYGNSTGTYGALARATIDSNMAGDGFTGDYVTANAYIREAEVFNPATTISQWQQWVLVAKQIYSSNMSNDNARIGLDYARAFYLWTSTQTFPQNYRPLDGTATSGPTDASGELSYNTSPEVFGDTAQSGSSSQVVVGGVVPPQWVVKTPIPTHRYSMGVVAVGGLIHVFGGITSQGNFRHYAYNPATDTWATKADVPDFSRESFAAVALNGKIYKMGGWSWGTRCEVYDPVTNAWTALTSMPTGRNYPAAAAAGGKIYVFGGAPSVGTYTDVVEEYDPVGNSWTTKSPMPTFGSYSGARRSAQAVAYNDKIYVIGGVHETPSGATSFMTLEYTPATDAWVNKAVMYGGRSAGAAAEYKGLIYYTGGVASNGFRQSHVQIYDVAANEWSYSPADSMIEARTDHGAAVVDGKLYAIGGTTSTETTGTAKNHVFLKAAPIGQTEQGGVSSSTISGEAHGVEFGATSQGGVATQTAAPAAWEERTSMTYARHHLGVVRLGGLAHAMGGVGDPTRHEAYDPGTDTWSTKAAIPNGGDYGFAVCEYNGKAYKFGGTTSGTRTEVYDPDLDSWSTLADMPTSRYHLSAAALNNKIYVMGGGTGPGGELDTVEEYDPSTDTWATKASIPSAVWKSAIAVSIITNGEYIYLVGGERNGVTTPNLWKYTPATDAWQIGNDIPIARRHHTMVTYGGIMYLFGGYDSSDVARRELVSWNGTSFSWTQRTDEPMLAPRADHGGVELEGKIYAIGGRNSSGTTVATSEAYIEAPPAGTTQQAAVSSSTIVGDVESTSVVGDTVQDGTGTQTVAGATVKIAATVQGATATQAVIGAITKTAASAQDAVATQVVAGVATKVAATAQGAVATQATSGTVTKVAATVQSGTTAQTVSGEITTLGVTSQAAAASQVTAAVRVVGGIVTQAGAASVTAVGVRETTGSTVVAAGVGTATITGFITVAGSGDLAGSATQTTAGLRVVTGHVSATGAGDQAAAGTTTRSGQASQSGASAQTTAATRTTFGVTGQAASGAVSVAATRTSPGATAQSASAAQAAVATHTVVAQVAVNGVATQTALGLVEGSENVLSQAVGSQVAYGFATTSATTVADAVSAATVAGVVTRFGSATQTGQAAQSSSGSKATTAATSQGGAGAQAVAGTKVRLGQVSVSSLGSQVSAATRTSAGQTSQAGAATATPAAKQGVFASSANAGVATNTIAGTRVVLGVASQDGNATQGTSTTRTTFASTTEDGEATQVAVGFVEGTNSILVSAVSSATISSSVESFGAVVANGASTSTAAAVRGQFGTFSLLGSGAQTAEATKTIYGSLTASAASATTTNAYATRSADATLNGLSTAAIVGTHTTLAGSDSSLRWDTLEEVGDQVEVIWDTEIVLGVARGDITLYWDTEVETLLVGTSVDIRWDVRSAVGASSNLDWRVLVTATAARIGNVARSGDVRRAPTKREHEESKNSRDLQVLRS